MKKVFVLLILFTFLVIGGIIIGMGAVNFSIASHKNHNSGLSEAMELIRE